MLCATCHDPITEYEARTDTGYVRSWWQHDPHPDTDHGAAAAAGRDHAPYPQEES